MSTELLFTTQGGKGIGATVEIDMAYMRPKDFMPLYVAFSQAAGCKRSPDFVTMLTLHPGQCANGIYWHETLCPDGMRITLVVPPKVDTAAVNLAKARLRAKFRVVSIKTLRVNQWVTIPEKLSTFKYANHQAK